MHANLRRVPPYQTEEVVVEDRITEGLQAQARLVRRDKDITVERAAAGASREAVAVVQVPSVKTVEPLQVTEEMDFKAQ